MNCRMHGPWLAAVVALSFGLPVGAQDSEPPPTPSALQNESSSTGTNDNADWKSKNDASARKTASERDIEAWSIALIGPVAMIFTVTALGLTITLRSLRRDFRRQRDLNEYWRHGAMTRARNGGD
jgi:hypothetical protein